MSTATPSPTGPANAEIAIAVGRLEHLFQAPPVDPFSPRAVDALGVAGIEYVSKRLRQAWPRQAREQRLRVLLPAGQLPEDGAQREQLQRAAQAAVRSYCAARVSDSHAARRLAVRAARTDLLIAAAVTLVAVLLLWLVLSGRWVLGYPFLQGVAIVLTVLAASLAVWDALEARFFDPVPFLIDAHTFAALGRLDVVLAPDLAPDDPAAAVGA